MNEVRKKIIFHFFCQELAIAECRNSILFLFTFTIVWANSVYDRLDDFFFLQKIGANKTDERDT